MSEKKKVNSCFAPIPDDCRPVPCEEPVYETTIKEYFLVPYSEQVGDDVNNVVLKYKPLLKNEYDLNDYIQSFSDDVGIQNIIKKLALSGDTSLLNQTGREPLCKDGGLEPIQDYSNAPRSKVEAYNSVLAGVNAFDNLPEDLKGKMSLTQFVELFGQEQFDSYIKGLIEKSAVVKGEENV